MTDNTQPTRFKFPWRILGWGALAVLLSLPAILKFPWTLSDFVFAGVILGGAGLVVELIVWASSSLAYRLAGLLALLGCVGLVWVNGAVGFFASEDNVANLIFLGVIAIAVVGSVIVRFKAAGLAKVLFTAAAAQVLVGAVGYFAGWASEGNAGIYEVVMGTTLFGSMWLVSGGLFRMAAEKGA